MGGLLMKCLQIRLTGGTKNRIHRRPMGEYQWKAGSRRTKVASKDLDGMKDANRPKGETPRKACSCSIRRANRR